MNYFDVLLARKLEDKRDPQIVGLSVTENGTYSEEGKVYKPVIVNVPEKIFKTKSITANGTYKASDDNADGYSQVSVNVPLPANAYLLKSVANLPQAIASFNDGEDMVMPSLKVAIEPQQEGSGDPSPTNVRPISGWDATNVVRAGKNFLNMTEYDSLTNCTYNNGTFTATSRSNLVGAFVRLFKNGSVVRTISKQAVAGGIFESALTFDDTWDSMIVGYLMSAQNIAVNYIKPSVPNGDYTISFKTNILPSSSVDGVFSNIQIEKNNIATTFEPYAGTTYTIDLDGTRYGGEVDVVNGVGKVLSADTTITENDNIELATNASGFLFFIVGKAQNAKNNNQQICDRLIRAESGSASTLYTAESGFVVYENGIVYFKVNSELDSVASIKNYLSSNPIHIVYSLATPLIIQLSPTAVKSLLGSNNVWADTGDIKDAEYFSKETE